MADALSLLRLALAALLPWLLVARSPGALVVWAVAALSDYADGPLARRRGGSRWGGVLDVAGDVAFVGGGLVTAAALGLVPVLAPVAVACSVAAYALASARASRAGTIRLARSRLGHWAGIANWGCVGLVAGEAALPGPPLAPLLPWAGAGVAAINLVAVLGRALAR